MDMNEKKSELQAKLTRYQERANEGGERGKRAQAHVDRCVNRIEACDRLPGVLEIAGVSFPSDSDDLNLYLDIISDQENPMVRTVTMDHQTYDAIKRAAGLKVPFID